MRAAAEGAVLFERMQRIGVITLNRPAQLNAVNLAMVEAITAKLAEWRDDPFVQLVVLEGAGDRGLCAGGDVVALHKAGAGVRDLARRFWQQEYALIAMIARFPKPFVSLMDGTVMGGGIGIAAHAGYRVVTERSRLAVPETAIGLIPDAGSLWLLSRLEPELGAYLGLTGQIMGPGDAIAVDFADGMVAAAGIEDLKDRLANPYAGPFEKILNERLVQAEPGGLAQHRKQIAQTFGHASLEAILSALETLGGTWAAGVRDRLLAASPTSLKLTLAALKRARACRSLEEALNLEYMLVTRLLNFGDFLEGIRAMLVDKDHKPAWSPPTLAETTPVLLDEFFAPMLPGEPLTLRPPPGA